MAVRAILFDLDSTLWRVEQPPHWDVVSDLQCAQLAPDWRRLGFDHLDLSAFVRTFWANFGARSEVPNPTLEEWTGGSVVQDTLAGFGARCEDTAANSLWDGLNNLPSRYYNISPFPDAPSTLEALHWAGYRLAVITNRRQRDAILHRELRDQGLPDVFDAIVTSGDVGFQKPHPLVFESALGRLQVAPGDALAVGDNYENDVVPAAKLGLVAVLKLNEREPDPACSLAHYQVPSLSALLDLPEIRQKP